jgi:hypothetical protein
LKWAKKSLSPGKRSKTWSIWCSVGPEVETGPSYEPDALDASRDWGLVVPELAPTMKTDLSFHAGKVHEEEKSER